jgi:gas vesicle protein
MASKLLAGFALGFVAGMLLAPDKGSETRKKIAQKGKDLKNKFNDFVDTIQDKYGEVAEEVEETVTEASSSVRPSYSGGYTGGTSGGYSSGGTGSGSAWGQ